MNNIQYRVPHINQPPQSDIQPQQVPAQERDPSLVALDKIKSRLEGDLYDFFVKKVEEKCKKTSMAIKVFVKGKDENDFVNSLQRLHKKLV